MKKALEIAAVLTLSTVMALMLALTLAVHHLDRELGMTMRAIHASADETALTMRNLRNATATWKEASERSIDMEVQAKADLETFQTLVGHTDFELNQQVLPRLRAAIAANSAQLVELEKTSTVTLTEFSQNSTATLRQSQGLLASLNRTSNDPMIAATLHNVEVLTSSLDETSANLAGTSKDLEDVADKFRETYLKPQKVAWELLKTLIGMGGSMAQMVK